MTSIAYDWPCASVVKQVEEVRFWVANIPVSGGPMDVTLVVTASPLLEHKPILPSPTLLHLTINTGAHSAKLNLPYSSLSYRTGPQASGSRQFVGK